MDYAWMTAAELAAAYRAGTMSPVEAVDAALTRMRALEPTLNAMAHVAPAEAAMDAWASAARIKAGAPLSGIDGIPITVKDNILVEGMPASWGSRVLGDHVPSTDELPVARLRAAGAIILGKTNVPEFTLEGYTGSLRFGTTRNPYDPALTPGGSSGGAVASVAAGYTPFAIATDGGGSIRRPASHTGLVGFKPSTGRVPRLDGFPAILLDFEVVGPVARSVADIMLLDGILSVPDERDHRARIARCGTAGTRPRRVAYLQRFPGQPLEPEIAASTDDAASVLQELGCEIEPIADLPFRLEDVTAIWSLVVQVGVAHLRASYGADVFDALAAPKYVAMAEEGQRISAQAFLADLEALSAFRRTIAEFFRTTDLLLTPAAAALPWRAEDAFPSVIDGTPVGPRGHAVYTGWVNMCGHPAIALPSTPSAAGLPIGVQLVGGFGQDELLLALAGGYEKARPWLHHRPAMDAHVR